MTSLSPLLPSSLLSPSPFPLSHPLTVQFVWEKMEKESAELRRTQELIGEMEGQTVEVDGTLR
jgi:hypothetical protein